MLNKTQKELQGATELAPNKKPIHLFLGVVLLFFGVWAVVNGISSVLDSKSRLYAPNKNINVEIVDTNDLRMKGLSGREGLDTDTGMLFVFENQSVNNCFVMRDMKFSIDMVWLNEKKEVLNVSENVSPNTYPEEIFCPVSPAKYGLELNAGSATQAGITPGVTLKF